MAKNKREKPAEEPVAICTYASVKLDDALLERLTVASMRAKQTNQEFLSDLVNVALAKVLGEPPLTRRPSKKGY